MDGARSQQHLQVSFDLEKREFRLGFGDVDKAIAYQNVNREARIYSNDRTGVNLPLAKEMKYIRHGSTGMIIGFENKDEAERWCERSVVGQVHPRWNKEVRINVDWEEGQLERRLYRSRRLSPQPPRSRSPGAKLPPYEKGGPSQPPTPINGPSKPAVFSSDLHY